MSDDNKDGQNPPADNDAETSFWQKLEKTLDERIDAGIKRTVETYTKPSGSRNGGRSSIPQVLAKLMGGPFNPVE